MSSFSDFLNQKIFGNEVENYLWFFGIIAAGFLLKRLLFTIFGKLAFYIVSKNDDRVNFMDFLRILRTPVQALIFFAFLFAATRHLVLPDYITRSPDDLENFRYAINIIYRVTFIIIITWLGFRILNLIELILTYRIEENKSDLNIKILPFIKEFTKFILVIISSLLILGLIFHVNIGTLIAGLGIGGLAIAFAGKETIENLFASFTIFLDKPFAVGDMVEIGTITGNVEKIGFRSTRIRTLEKSFLTLPNKQMIDQALNNLTLRSTRRVKFNLSLTYDTPISIIKNIIAEIHIILNEHPMVLENPIVRFAEFSSSSLDILIIYFVNTPEWPIALEIKENINFDIIEIVLRNQASFAFPSTTVYFDRDKHSVINE
ncbi:MAG: mechanosensitive ion channel family protein [Bacteroidota bacterium]|nr:mechanosensitive ion channel family protein [Bacteroidota bacterium]